MLNTNSLTRSAIEPQADSSASGMMTAVSITSGREIPSTPMW